MSCVDNWEIPGKAPQRMTGFHPCCAREQTRRSRKMRNLGRKKETDKERGRQERTLGEKIGKRGRGERERNYDILSSLLICENIN